MDDIFITNITNVTEIESEACDKSEDTSNEVDKDKSSGNNSNGGGHGKPSPRSGLKEM